jgi:hypothetical protein
MTTQTRNTHDRAQKVVLVQRRREEGGGRGEGGARLPPPTEGVVASEALSSPICSRGCRWCVGDKRSGGRVSTEWAQGRQLHVERGKYVRNILA